MGARLTKKRIAVFIRQYGKDIVDAISNKNLYFEAVVAQKALESAFGTSELVANNNNFFGLMSNGTFVKFNSPNECFLAYVEIVESEFSKALIASSPEEQLYKMAESGYIGNEMTPTAYVKKCKPYIDAVRNVCGIGKVKNGSSGKEWEFNVIRNNSELIEKVTVKQK